MAVYDADLVQPESLGASSKQDPITERRKLKSLSWYHPHLTRHQAECMLIDNAPEGTFLLRPHSQNTNDFSVSIKSAHSVLHVEVISHSDDKYSFGTHLFNGEEELVKHLEQETPVIGGDSGAMVTLRYPYSRDVPEPHLYMKVTHHAIDTEITTSMDSMQISQVHRQLKQKSIKKILVVSSKEGYLTKEGYYVKSWKKRWFVLRNNKFMYYKSSRSESPIRTINMLEASEVEYDHSKGRENCFRIVLPWRTFYMYSSDPDSCKSWVDILRTKIAPPPTEENPQQDSLDRSWFSLA